MSYLPTILTEELKEAQEIISTESIYSDFNYDVANNKFTGSVVEGVEALKGWIYFALKIARYRYPIFSYFYGCELETLISKTIDDEEYLQSETQRYIEDALLINPYIKEVKNIKVSKDEEKISIKCTVTTKYGDVLVSI